jgi:hypothetical protein
MKVRFILFRRAGTYYCEDTVTRKQTSLRTKKENEAVTMLNARNESFRQPQLNIQIARAYLTASEGYRTGTWSRQTEPANRKISHGNCIVPAKWLIC